MTEDAILLTHGAGSDADSPLLVALDTALSARLIVHRYNLSFRQKRGHGPPLAGDAARDRAGLRENILALRRQTQGRIFLGGHSYGGRQSSMLAAEEPGLIDGLLLLSYPLHPPRKPEQLRTGHFPALRTPVLFVHGSRDPFGSFEELHQAVAGIPGCVEVLALEGCGHELKPALAEDIGAGVFRFFGLDR